MSTPLILASEETFLSLDGILIQQRVQHFNLLVAHNYEENEITI